MAVLNWEFVRSLRCHWEEAEAIGALVNILGGPPSAASSYLSCYDGGSRATATSSTRPMRSTAPSSLPTSSTADTSSSSPQVTFFSSQEQPPSSSTISTTSTLQPTNQPSITTIPQGQPPSLSTIRTTSTLQPTTQPSITTITPQIVSSSAITSSSTITTLSSTQAITTQPMQSTSPNTTIQSSSPNPPPTSTSKSMSAASTIMLNATIPPSPLAASRASPAAQRSNSSGQSAFSGAGSVLGPESKVGAIPSKAGILIGILVPLVLIVAAFLTIFVCRRNRKKRLRESIGYAPETSNRRTWKKEEVTQPNAATNSEGVLDDNTRGEQYQPRRSMRDSTAQLPEEYVGEDTDFRLVTPPRRAFAGASRSSSTYSGGSYHDFVRGKRRSPPPAQVREDFDDGETEDPFMTPAELREEQRTRNLNPPAAAVLRPDIYMARQPSLSDIDDILNEFRQTDRELENERSDSALSNFSRNKPRPLFATPSGYRPSKPDYTRPDSRYAPSELSASDTSSMMRINRKQVSGQYSEYDSIGSSLSWNFDQDFRNSSPDYLQPRLESSRLRDELQAGDRYSDALGSSDTLNILQEYEEKEQEINRILEEEEERAMLYMRNSRPGMGVMEGGGYGTLGAQRGVPDWDLGVQNRGYYA